MNKPLVRTAMTVKAHAKLNLTLDVLGLLPDGYHEMLMVMHSVSLCDDVTVSLSAREAGNHVRITVSGKGFERSVPPDNRNTAFKAVRAFFDAAEITGCRADIAIKKRIPVGAGLGGGSADAAAVLRALNAMFGGLFDDQRLCEIGTSVGSDVPFCVLCGTMLARGRGELLTPLPPLPRCAIVIVKPAFSVSTAELFRKIDGVNIVSRPDTGGMIASLEARDLRGIAHRCLNVFEQALPEPRRLEIDEIKSHLSDLGSIGCAMTGTGSAVFGIFEDEKTARLAHGALAADYNSFFCASP